MKKLYYIIIVVSLFLGTIKSVVAAVTNSAEKCDGKFLVQEEYADIWGYKYNEITGRAVRCDEEGKETEKVLADIFQAVEAGDCEKIDDILSQNNDVDLYAQIGGVKNTRGYSGPLFYHVLRSPKESKCLPVILKYNPPMEKTVFEENLIDDMEAMRLWADEDEGVNAPASGTGTTALLYASMQSNFPAIKMLAEQGANINAKDNDGDTPLHYAARHKQRDIVKFLLEHGADVNAKNNKGVTPMFEAAGYMIKTPFFSVFEKGNIDIMCLLLSHGADINAVNNNNHTPLHYAIGSQEKELIEFMRSLGALDDAQQSEASLNVTLEDCLKKAEGIRGDKFKKDFMAKKSQVSKELMTRIREKAKAKQAQQAREPEADLSGD